MLLEVNPVNPEPRKIRRAVEALQAGEVIAYPTDTVYGLGCDLFNKKAVALVCFTRCRLTSFRNKALTLLMQILNWDFNPTNAITE